MGNAYSCHSSVPRDASTAKGPRRLDALQSIEVLLTEAPWPLRILIARSFLDVSRMSGERVPTPQ